MPTVPAPTRDTADVCEGATSVITLGLILLILGLVLGVGILTTIGVILLVVGLILFALGSMGRAVGGRRHYW